jgi:hypothetical protein
METLSEGDIKFLLRKTKLNREQLNLLCEESSDRYLVFNEISECLRPTDIKKLSFATSVFLTIFNKSLTTCFDINEKVVISRAIVDQYPEILNKSKFKLVPTKTTTTEKQAFYFLVLYGLHFDNITNFKDVYIKYIEDAFFRADKRDISKHVDTWLAIMRGIKRDGWFTSIPATSEPVLSIEQIKNARMVAPV